jgi:S1-C subfamily serine protease
MSDSPHSWTCPQCGRRVPSRVSECRCGLQQPDDGLAGDAPSAVAAAVAAPTSSILPWIVLGVVTLAAAGTLIALQVIPVRPQPQAATSGSTAASAPAFAPGASASAPGGAPADKSAGGPVAAHTPGASGSPIASDAVAPVAPNAPVATAPVAPASLEDVVSRSLPAIVSIEAGDARGSGFFAAPRMVVTNRHVVENNISVTVRLASGATLPGRVERSSQEFDLAIVRVDSASPSQPLLPLGSVSDVRPGQEVIAIGLALGVFQNSVTRGIISAVRRAEKTVLLQTDAAINPGNSGGPLLNRNGQVIGINTLKISGTAESLGFAVAVDHASALLSGTRGPDLPLSSRAPVSKPLTPAFDARSSTDQMRTEGVRRYDQVVQAVARRGSELDDYWSRIKEHCSTRVAPGYDREWFGLWDGRSALTSPDPSCISAVSDLTRLANEVRSLMGSAQDDARRAAVLPGQLREIRRRYRMDWRGWDR